MSYQPNGSRFALFLGMACAALCVLSAPTVVRAVECVPQPEGTFTRFFRQVGGITLSGQTLLDADSGGIELRLDMLTFHYFDGPPPRLLFDSQRGKFPELHVPLSMTTVDSSSVLLADGAGQVFKIDRNKGDVVSLADCFTGRLTSTALQHVAPLESSGSPQLSPPDQTVRDIAWAGADRLIVMRPWSIECVSWSTGSILWSDSQSSLLAGGAAHSIFAAVKSPWGFSIGQCGFTGDLAIQNDAVVAFADGRLSYLDPATGRQLNSVDILPVVDACAAGADGQSFLLFSQTDLQRATNLFIINPSRGIYEAYAVSTLDDVIERLPAIETASRARILGWWSNRLATFPTGDER